MTLKKNLYSLEEIDRFDSQLENCEEVVRSFEPSNTGWLRSALSIDSTDVFLSQYVIMTCR